MLDYPLTRFLELATLTPEEAIALRELGGAEQRFRRNGVIRRDREPMHCFHLLLEGWATSAIRLPNGQRQIVKIHIAGDMMGTPSMALETSADTLTALTDCRIAEVPFARLRTLLATHRRMGALFMMAVQVERVALMDIVASMGKSSARERLATLLLDLHDRLSTTGAVESASFDLPLTQEQIGDVLGITAVHVNRTMRLLERDGLVARHGHRIALSNLAALRQISPLPPRRVRFDPPWLPDPGEL